LGIPNRAFYLVAVGLGGYSWEKAGQIWYATLRDPALKQDSDFKTFANITIANAFKLYGKDVQCVVEDAWKTVGVPLGA